MTDVITFGSERPPGRRARWLVPLVVVALSGIAVGGLIVHRHRAPRPPQAKPTASAVSGVFPAPAAVPCAPVRTGPDVPVEPVMTGVVISDPGVGATLESCDRTAFAGQWVVVVRQPGGSLGRHGAVVTYPVPAPAAGSTVAVGGVSGRVEGNAVIWPVGTGYARVRGDLGQALLVSIAAHTSVPGGHPAVDPPSGLQVVRTGPYRPLVVSEARYDADQLGEGGTLGGLVFTGMTTGGGYDDQLFSWPAEDSGTVDGHPAVVSAVFGGNAALAWEPVPGTIAYVGYSGALSDARTTAALHRLAARARILTADQWRRTGPAVLDQPNEPG